MEKAYLALGFGEQARKILKEDYSKQGLTIEAKSRTEIICKLDTRQAGVKE